MMPADGIDAAAKKGVQHVPLAALRLAYITLAARGRERWQVFAHCCPVPKAAPCPQLAEGDIRALAERSGFDPNPT